MSEYKVPFASQRLESVVIQKPEEVEAIAQLEKLLSLALSRAKVVIQKPEKVEAIAQLEKLLSLALSQAKVVIQKPQQPEEVEAIAQLEKLLRREPSQAKLVSGNGEEVLIPESVYLVLRDIVQMMASGQPIHLLPDTHELTTQEAADILNVSRPFLVKLLDRGEIPYIKVGSHRRIRFRDVIAYKEQRNMKRGKLLDKLIEMSEEAGLYEYKE